MHATRLEASLYILTHVLKTFSARRENKGAYSTSTTVKTVLFVWQMNKPFTVSLEGIGQCMLHPDILFCLQPFWNTLHSSCLFNTTRVLGTHFATVLQLLWRTEIAYTGTSFYCLSHPMVLMFPRLLLVLASHSTGGSSAPIPAIFQKFQPMLLRMWIPLADSHALLCWVSCAAWAWMGCFPPSSSAVSTRP